MNKTAIYIAVLLSLSVAAVSAADEKKAGDSAKATPTKSSASAKIWSWQPVQNPAEPVVKQKQWVRTPIDAFVLARLEAQGIKPSQDTDRAAFIRRATLDELGVIPTPEEVKAFVNDRSPNAYEKLVDRLLASPHYGERQARRWLDLARYADSTGFQNDTTRPNMWRYRDYVINAFNQDKPYDRFIKEQLAGDEIAPNDQNALIATGFLIGYPDNYNSRDLVQRKYQIETDMIDTVGQTFLGTTLSCARCHNHKTDKISQKDYFQLQAFLANTSVNEKVLAIKGEQEAKYEQTQAKYLEATKDIRDKQKAILEIYREVGVKYHKERYLTDSREAIFKPASQWTSLDRWVNHRLDNISNDRDIASYMRLVAADKNHPQHTKELEDKWADYQKLALQLKKFDHLKPESGSRFISALTELGSPVSPPTHVRFTGTHERPLEEVQPAFPASITDEKPNIVPTATSSGRRTALADWIASPKNPLTSRVFVNRVWSQYFGTGIVRTVSDFGKAGDKPSNPELLDYLADNFIKEGWSVKKLHRQILLSSVYRQSSNHRDDAFKADPENKLLAVFPRRRLDAEQIRDSLLVASGRIENRLGGPAVLPPLPANVVAGSNNFDDNPFWTVSKDVRDHNRRSVYVFTRRSVPYPLLESFDMANPQLVHSKRDVTTTPLQALTLFNSELVFGWSQALAGRVIREAGNNESAQLDKLYQILLARNADKSEKAALHEFLVKQTKTIKEKTTDGKFAVNLPTGLTGAQTQDPIQLAAFVDLVHTVANSNEFSYRF